MLEFRVFSHAHQVFDEMLERAFICVLEQLTYAERRGSANCLMWMERMTSIWV